MKRAAIEKQDAKKRLYDEIMKTSPEIFQKIDSQQKTIFGLQDDIYKFQEQNRQLKELYNKAARENMELKKQNNNTKL